MTIEGWRTFIRDVNRSAEVPAEIHEAAACQTAKLPDGRRHSNYRRHEPKIHEWRHEMRVWTNHPILFAGLIGGLIGLVNAAFFLLTDPLRPFSDHVLLYLFPTSILGFGFNGGSLGFSIFLATVEVGGNAILYACTFAAPVALVVAIRRQFGTPEGPTSIGRS
jgi:hypothetical protein